MKIELATWNGDGGEPGRLSLFFWALSVSLSLFGFQIIGGFSDYIQMDSPRPLSLVLRFGTAAIFTLLLFYHHFKFRYHFSTKWILRIGLSFLILYGINLYFKTTFSRLFLRYDPILYMGYYLTFVFIPFLAVVFISYRQGFHYLFNILLILTNFIVLIYLSFFDFDFIISMRFVPFRSVNPIGIGYVGLVSATLSLWLFFTKDSSFSVRFYSIILCIGSIFLALLSGQRQTFISLVITIPLFYLAVLGGKIKHPLPITLIIGSIILIISTFVSRYDVLFNPIERLIYTHDRISLGNEQRMAIWNEAIRIALDNPIFGGPVEMVGWQIYPHNLVLEAFMATGILVGSLFMLYFLCILFYAIILISYKEFAWLALLHFQMAVSSLLSGSLFENTWYWVTSGLVFSAYQIARNSYLISSKSDSLVMIHK